VKSYYSVKINGKVLSPRYIRYLEVFPESMILKSNFNEHIDIEEKVLLENSKIYHVFEIKNKSSSRKKVKINIDFFYYKDEDLELKVDKLRDVISLKNKNAKRGCIVEIDGIEKKYVCFVEERRIREDRVSVGGVEAELTIDRHSSKNFVLFMTNDRDLYDREVFKKSIPYYDPYNINHTILVTPSPSINRLYFWAVRELNNLGMDVNKMVYFNKLFFKLRKSKVPKLKDLDKAIIDAINHRDVYSLVSYLILLEGRKDYDKIIAVLEELSYDIVSREYLKNNKLEELNKGMKSWNIIDVLYIYAFVIKFFENLFLKKTDNKNEVVIDYRLPRYWPYMELHNVEWGFRTIDIAINRIDKGHTIRISNYSDKLDPLAEPISVKVFKNPEIGKMNVMGVNIKNKDAINLKKRNYIELKLHKNSYIEIEAHYWKQIS